MPNGVGGSGGGGGPVGFSNSFTGAAEAIEVIGEHAYAYSGLQAISETAADHLKFTTGNYYFVGRLYCNGAAAAGSANGQVSTYEVKFNGVAIALIRTKTSSDDQPSTEHNDLLIPPYTEVAVSVDSGGGGAETTSLVLTGRIYR